MKKHFLSIVLLLPFMIIACSSGGDGNSSAGDPQNPFEDKITDVSVPQTLPSEVYSPSKGARKYKPIMVKYSGLKASVNWNSANESKTRILCNMEGFKPETDYQKYKNSVNKYGSSTVLPRQNATGRFYTKKIDGRWWIVDPEGYLHIHRGVTSFTLGKATNSKSAFAAKYGTEDTWTYLTATEINTLGINAVGAFSTPYTHILNHNENNPTIPFIYSPSFGFVSGAKSKGGYKYPDDDSDLKVGVILYDGFAENVKKYAESSLEQYKNDPNLFGVFSDNELNFSSMKTYLLREMLSIKDDTNQAKKAAVSFMEGKHLEGTVSSFDVATNKEALNDEFAGQVAEIYFKACRDAIKAVDPNMLYLGSRLHGTPKYMKSVYEAAGRYCDVISINYYSRWSPELTSAVDEWEQWADAPFFVTEFYACGADVDLDNDGGAGWLVRTQEERAFFYQHFTLGLLESKNCVGWDWFRYQDSSDASDGMARNNGLYSQEYEIYPELAQYMRDLNTNVYNIINYYDK